MTREPPYHPNLIVAVKKAEHLEAGDVDQHGTCPAVTRAKRNFQNHTHRCQLAKDHDGAHEWKDGAGRTVSWYGEACELPTNMRYRFGLDPHWQMK